MQKPILIKEQTVIRKLCRMACIFLILLCSCNSSKHASQKRRKMAPCDCPKFNYVPQNDFESGQGTRMTQITRISADINLILNSHSQFSIPDVHFFI